MSNKILSLMGYEMEPEKPIYHQAINIEPEQKEYKFTDEICGFPVIVTENIDDDVIYMFNHASDEVILEIDRVEYIGNNEYRIIFKDEDNGREEE
jgi:hypothetical protein